ncbi:MAG: hypothetical protein JNK23_02485 [Opitutaceae bacterium]|nr:hypothetical protein [Opitutaceae bacterium]
MSTLLKASLALFLLTQVLHSQTSFTVRNAKRGGDFLWGIASSSDRLVAVGERGTILTSVNGTNWIRSDSGSRDWLVGITYGLGRFVVVGDRGIILTSSDSVRWNKVSTATTTHRLNNVTFVNGQFVAVGEAGTILTSLDATEWAQRPSGTTGWLRGIAYADLSYRTAVYAPAFRFVEVANQVYLAIGQGGRAVESSDGIAWSPSTARGANDFEALIYAISGRTAYSTHGGAFVSVGESGAVTADEYFFRQDKFGTVVPDKSRLDGSTGNAARIRGLVQGANALFATGENGTILSAPSHLGPWTPAASGTTANLVNGVYANQSLFVVGEDETILQSTALYPSRLQNISSRGFVGTDDNILVSGLVIAGSAPKTCLIRAAGPAMAAFGVAGNLAAPVIVVRNGAGRTMAANAGWSSDPSLAAAAARVGALAFAPGSADAALLVSLEPGSYTVEVAGRDRATGTALVEVYDMAGPEPDGARTINLSTRGTVGGSAGNLIAGFSIGGTASRRVALRAVGPSLAAFGISNALISPVLELYREGEPGPRATAQGVWSARPDADLLRSSSTLAGAFALIEDSKDCIAVSNLAPGNYTAVVRSADNASGVALVEIYDLP